MFTNFIKNGTRFTFIPSQHTPENLTVTAIANIAQLDSYFVLIKDKDGLDNLIFGHIEKDELPQESVKRESMEEAGIEIDNIAQIGYIMAEKIVPMLALDKYPQKSVINVYHSFVVGIQRNWRKLETESRELLSYKKAKIKLSLRNDNNQLLEIMEYTYKFTQQLIAGVDFKYIFEAYNPSIPVSQVFNFAKDKNNNFCIVRDFDENHFSLPGGGCELGESWKECSIRETLEEAQIHTINTRIIGVFLLSYRDSNNNVIHQTQHIRTTSNCDEINTFLPRKNGFETEERIFISKDNLAEYIDWLRYEGGLEMLLKI